MKPRATTVSVALAGLRYRRGRTAMCIIGVTAGVALAVAVRVQTASLMQGQGIERALVGRTSIEAVGRGPDGMPVSVFRAVQKLRSVTVTAPILLRNVAIEGPRGRRAVLLVGADRRLRQIGSRVAAGLDARVQAGDIGLYLSTDLAGQIGVRPGDAVTVFGPSGPRETLLSDTLGQSTGEAIGSAPIAVAPLGLAQMLTGQNGRLTRLLIEEATHTQADRRALRAAVGRAGELRAPGWESRLVAQASAIHRRVTDLFAVMCLLLGAVVVYAVTLLAAVDRRCEIATLKALGCPPAGLVGVLVCEAVLTGAAGGLAGTISGWGLARALGSLPADNLSFAFSLSDDLRLDRATAATAIVGGVVIAIGATLAASASLLAESPASALASRREGARRARLSRARGAAGVTALLVAGILTAIAPRLGVLAVCLLFLAATLLVADVLGLLVRGLERVLPAPGGVAALGISEIRCSPGRGAAAAALVVVVVAGVIMLNSSALNFQRSADEVSRDTFSSGDLWATAVSNDAWMTRPMTPAARDLIRNSPVVTAVRSHRTVSMDWQGRRVLVYSADTVAPQSSLRIDDHGRMAPTPAARSLRAGTGMLIGRELAAAHHVKLRDRVTIPTPSGPRALQIVGFVANYGWPPGIIGLSSPSIRRWWGEPSLTALKVDVRAGADMSRARRRLQALVQPLGIEIDAPGRLRARVRTTTHAGLAPLRKIALVLAILGALAATVSLIAVILQRARRVAMLRAIGMQSRQVLQSLIAEFATIALSGALVGVLTGLAAHRMVVHYLVAVHGYPAEYGIEPLVLAFVLTLVATAVLVIPVLSLWWLAKVAVRNGFADA